jgi:hypothetical protein
MIAFPGGNALVSDAIACPLSTIRVIPLMPQAAGLVPHELGRGRARARCAADRERALAVIPALLDASHVFRSSAMLRPIGQTVAGTDIWYRIRGPLDV